MERQREREKRRASAHRPMPEQVVTLVDGGLLYCPKKDVKCI